MRLSRKIGLCLLLAMPSLSASGIFNIRIGGLIDFTDMCVFVSLLFFAYSAGAEKPKLSRYTFFVVFFLVLSFVYSISRDYQFRYILPDIRNTIYMVLAFNIFRSKQTDLSFIIDKLPIFGLINSIIILLNTGFFAGDFSRDIFSSLWYPILGIACVLFEKEKRNTLIKYISLVFGMIAVLISQTRSLIIPLIAMLMIYAVIAIKERNPLKTLIVVALVGICIFVLTNQGYMNMLLQRLEGTLDEESTMWLRFDNAKAHIRKMTFREKLIGEGFGKRFFVVEYDGDLRETLDLEMFFFNQLSEWGIIALCANYFYYIRTMIKNKITRKPLSILVGSVVVLIGGFVSGLVGSAASIVLGMVFGMLSNPATRDSLSRKRKSSIA